MLLRFFLLTLLIKNATSTTTDELKEELRLVRLDIGLLKVENKNQSDQIALLKGMVESQNKIIDEKIVEELNKKMKDCAITGDDSLSPEQKQLFRIISSVHPYVNTKNCRLLATVVYDGVFKPKNLPENSTTNLGRFYGQPTSCSDLSQLGYTLNGFYVVKSNNESTNSSEIKLDNVFCAFKQPEGAFNSSLVEKRIISRRETSSSSARMIFHAIRKTDLPAPYAVPFTITFDKVRLNSENSFDATTGMFTIPKSGLYLLIFRSKVAFPPSRVSDNKQFYMYYKLNAAQTGTSTTHGYGHFSQIGLNVTYGLGPSFDIELEKVVKGIRGDTYSVMSHFSVMGPMAFTYGSLFIGYLLDEYKNE